MVEYDGRFPVDKGPPPLRFETIMSLMCSYPDASARVRRVWGLLPIWIPTSGILSSQSFQVSRILFFIVPRGFWGVSAVSFLALAGGRFKVLYICMFMCVHCFVGGLDRDTAHGRFGHSLFMILLRCVEEIFAWPQWKLFGGDSVLRMVSLL